ncbi:hypothetical protein [uncultured Bacteroides sp.]|uniref:hypothetical protein n=1 Tax=uncultured Bacteroides sp. TaxID=162156 RepID=UPI002AAB1E9A|nr:hypothetical protein [uncultured Bacteroides sp.]
MKTIEEAAKESAEAYEELRLGKLCVKKFVEGVEFAHKWIDVKDELPDENEFVLCKMKSNDAIVGGYIQSTNGRLEVLTLPNFEFEDCMNYEPISWRPIEYK